MAIEIVPEWMVNLDDEDVSFIKKFIMSSGSLKEVANQYGVTYPTVRLRPVSYTHLPITSTGVSGLMAAIILFPFTMTSRVNYLNMSNLALTAVVYIILFPSLLSFVFWNIGVREIGAGKTGIFLNLNPVFTAFISRAMGKDITWVQVIGGLLVLSLIHI